MTESITPQSILISVGSGLIGVLLVIIGWYFVHDQEEIISILEDHDTRIDHLELNIEVLKKEYHMTAENISDNLNEIRETLYENRLLVEEQLKRSSIYKETIDER